MSNLDKLMQMATLEQLNVMIQQMSKSTSYNEPKDVLSLPIVQKVISAYEDELKKKECVTSCNCKDYTELLDNILVQTQLYNTRFQRIENKLDEICCLIENKCSFLEVKPESSEIDKKQTKIHSYPGFFHYANIIEEIKEEPQVEIKVEPQEEPQVEIKVEPHEEPQVEIKVEPHEEPQVEIKVEPEEKIVEKENITLNIEESEPEKEITHTNIDLEITSDEDEEEDIDEEEEDEDEEAAEDKVAIEDEAIEEDESVEEDESDENVSTEEEVATEDEVEDQVELIKEDEAVEKEEKVEKEEDVEEDEEVFEIEIDDVTYYATDEENGILYEVDKDGEVGKKVGIIKDGEPIFS